MHHLKRLSFALMLGLATILSTVVLADAVLDMSSNILGMVVFWAAIILLPVYARRFVPWRYTLINLPWFYGLYFFFTSPAMLNWKGRFFCSSGTWISFYGPLTAVVTTLVLWGLESIVYALCNIISKVRKKEDHHAG